jgi:hypothetical protein
MPSHYAPWSAFTGKWTSGIFLALILILWGLCSLLTGTLVIPRRKLGGYTFHGPPATFLSIALLAIGLYFHFHHFWGTNPKVDHISTPGERWCSYIAGACIIIGLGWHFAGLLKTVS